MLGRWIKLNPTALMRLGLFSLVAGAVSLRFATRIPGMNSDRADLLSGFLYGVAIASLLVSIRLRQRNPRA